MPAGHCGEFVSTVRRKSGVDLVWITLWCAVSGVGSSGGLDVFDGFLFFHNLGVNPLFCIKDKVDLVWIALCSWFAGVNSSEGIEILLILAV